MPLIRARHDVFGVQDVPDNDWWREQGWTEVDPSTPTETEARILEEAAAFTKETGGAQFDPGEHTAAEVKDYIATADDAEAERVLTAEQSGKARTTVLSAADEA